MAGNRIEAFLKTWDVEAQNTLKVLRALPVTKYDFRPTPEWRSLGELAWHLAELDAYTSFCIDKGSFQLDTRPPNIERPRTVEALAPGYERVHREAVERIRKLSDDDLGRKMAHFDGKELKIADILWFTMLHHSIHHRGQLSLLCRIAGGTPPGVYGASLEERAAMRAASEQRKATARSG